MAKFKKIDNTAGQYIFFCPGCEDHHGISTAKEEYPCPVWGFNGDVDKPTVTPSILTRYGANPDASEEFKEWRSERICHSYITDGKIQYLNDCTHELAGQTIELPEFDDEQI
jgi:hypothetical protein